MNNKKKLLIIVGILFLSILLIAGSTFAYLQWAASNEQRTNVSFTQQDKGFSCSANGGGNITQNEIQLAPSLCTNNVAAIKREITATTSTTRGIPIYMDLWLDIKNITSGLSSSHNFRYALTTSGEGCNAGNVISTGSFQGTDTNDKIYISNNNEFTTNTTKTYYLYIWLDAEEEEDFTQDQAFHFELGGECRDNSVETPNKPYLYGTGLIPVKLSDNGATVTTVSENDSTWYDYDNKKWANAVLVKESGVKTREENRVPNTVINESDILAYYVWIPRYSYQVWAYAGNDSAGSAHEIPIRFVSTSVKDMAEAKGQWYTPPAFTFGDTELAGIWVGKFETHHTSYQTNSASSLGCSSTSCDSTKYNGLRILPNVRPLTNNTISSFFFASRAMETSGNDFGINPSTTDSHMMKNSEWGAVAYLSHSKYGINDEIRINNTYNIVYDGDTRTFLTGCGAGTPNESSEAACDIQYGTISNGSYPQSTTGNVTGIFDMSGGTNEYVMGTYNNSNSYSNTSSGFTSSNPLPDAKYYDNYANPPFDGTNSTNFTRCTLATCGGHALNETMNWHSDYAGFVISGNPWFTCGGGCINGSYAGAFFVSVGTGNAFSVTSARLVLLAE